jgi:hypothetical protein
MVKLRKALAGGVVAFSIGPWQAAHSSFASATWRRCEK